jgi:hypothetical protein
MFTTKHAFAQSLFQNAAFENAKRHCRMPECKEHTFPTTFVYEWTKDQTHNEKCFRRQREQDRPTNLQMRGSETPFSITQGFQGMFKQHHYDTYVMPMPYPCDTQVVIDNLMHSTFKVTMSLPILYWFYLYFILWVKACYSHILSMSQCCFLVILDF